MNKKYLLCCLLILVLLNIPFTALSNETRKIFKLIQAKGSINRDEIGMDILKVVSLWSDKPVLVTEDGTFSTVISNQRPQKLSLIDSRKRIRALAIAFPQYSDKIIFDAKSTAIAVLFNNSSSFGQSTEVGTFCALLEKKQSFQNLVLFLKENLKGKALEELVKDEVYMDILGKCNSEIFGDDPESIKNYLQAAQQKLENVLP